MQLPDAVLGQSLVHYVSAPDAVLMLSLVHYVSTLYIVNVY